MDGVSYSKAMGDGIKAMIVTMLSIGVVIGLAIGLATGYMAGGCVPDDEAIERAKVRQGALDKLTPEERNVLGL